MSKVAIVTGASSGIGKCAAENLFKKGIIVYEFSRRDMESKDIIHTSVDVTDEEAVNQAVKKIYEKEGHIDILINCAGFGISGAVEFTESESAKRQLDVNFFGTVNAVKSVLGIMRRQGSGRIVLTSSVAAAIPIPFQTFYSVSKAAINSYAMSLSNEVKPYGISVCAVMPGDTKTNFTASRAKSFAGDDEYGGRISRSVKVMENDEINGSSSEAAGAYLARMATKKKVKPLSTIGFKYKLFVVIMRLLPCSLSNWMLGLIYAK